MTEASFKSPAVIAGRAIGALFFSFFGSVLLEVWDYRAGIGVLMAALIAVLGAVLVTCAWLRYRRYAMDLALEANTPERKSASKVFHMVNVGQWLLILVLGNVQANTGLGAWVVPMAIFVIGLHFVPLAHVYRNWPHYVTALALIAFAMAYPFIANHGPTDPAGFCGAGLILWLSAAWAVRPTAVMPAAKQSEA